MAVILKNPSSASEQSSDKMVRTVCEMVWRRYPEIGSVVILNLFALRSTDSREVGEAIRQQGIYYAVGSDNDLVIAETLSTSQAVIIAWGGPAGIHRTPYQERIQQCTRLLATSRLPVFRNNRSGACFGGGDDKQGIQTLGGGVHIPGDDGFHTGASCKVSALSGLSSDRDFSVIRAIPANIFTASTG